MEPPQAVPEDLCQGILIVVMDVPKPGGAAGGLPPCDVAETCVGGELVSSAVQSLEAAGVDFTPRGSAQEKVQEDAKQDRGSELWSSGTSKLEVNPQICIAALDRTVLLIFHSCILLDKFSLDSQC